MKCTITTFFDGKSDFSYQATLRVEGASPFEILTGNVLDRPDERRSTDTILLGAKSPEELTRLIAEKRIGLTAFAASAGTILKIVTTTHDGKSEKNAAIQTPGSQKAITQAENLQDRLTLWAKQELDQEFIKAGGLVDCHRHLDRQDTLGVLSYRLIRNATLEEKWELTETLKRDPRYLDTLHDRIRMGVEDMISQGIVACRTYIDVDSTVELCALDAALLVKNEYKDTFYLQVAASPVKGLDSPQDLEWFLKGCERADVVGGLPSRGRRGVMDTETSLRSMRHLFEIARSLGKDLDMQIDQANDPDERETNILARLAQQERDKGFVGRIALTHAVSLSAYSNLLMQETIEKLAKARVDVIVCPGAALSMKPDRTKTAPIHNSIAPIPELIEKNVTVGIGTDNVSDIYMPFTTGDIREEIRELARAVRFQDDLEVLVRIATKNGRKVLGLTQ